MSFTKFSHNINKIFKDSICVVCIENDSDTIFSPCGHYCCCSNCSRKILTCPRCREKIDQVVPISEIHVREEDTDCTEISKSQYYINILLSSGIVMLAIYLCEIPMDEDLGSDEYLSYPH